MIFFLTVIAENRSVDISLQADTAADRLAAEMPTTSGQ